jgi:hypothetical protein
VDEITLPANPHNTTMKKYFIYAAVMAAVIGTGCKTPKLADYATKTDLDKKAKPDFNKAKIKDNGRGFCVDMVKLGQMPKRVAIISFYVDDPGITKVSGTNQTGKTYSTTNTGSSKAQEFANSFYNSSIESLKSTFKQYDIELLTPDQYLNDDDKKQFYNDFNVKHTTANQLGQKLAKWAKNAGNAGTTLEVDEAANGYKVMKVNNRESADADKKAVAPNNLLGSNDAQMIESTGYDLCKNLGVDAVLVIYNTQLRDAKWGKDRYWMGAVSMYMFGPNPLPLAEGKKDNMFYSKGLFYTGFRTAFKKGLIINPKMKKATDEEKAAMEKATYTAYNNVVTGLAKKTCTYLKDELGKKK